MCLECSIKDEKIKFLQTKYSEYQHKIDSLERKLLVTQGKLANARLMCVELSTKVKLNPKESKEDAWMSEDIKKLQNEI